MLAKVLTPENSVKRPENRFHSWKGAKYAQKLPPSQMLQGFEVDFSVIFRVPAIAAGRAER
jgi:hypothetical protein